MKNKETNIKKNNQRVKSKSTVKQRGYYYSKENIMKRKQFEKIEVDSKNYNEEIISTPIKLKWNNELELYNKNNSLIQFLEIEKNKFNYILNIFKELNKNFGDILIKPKIKIAEINKKIQNDQYKKEKENFIFNQNLSDKIDDALIKANLALEKVKNIGKKAIILPSTQNENNIYTKYALEKPKEKNELSEIIKRCQDKYVDSVQINKDNINTYFMSLTKNRTLFRDFKERIRRSKQKFKEYPNIFDDIYNKNKKKMDIDSINNNIIIYGDDNIIKEENKMIKICSILSSDLFSKLYNKVMFSDKNDNNNQINEEDIYNVFSLWFMINHIGVLLEENKDIEKLNVKLSKFYPLKFTIENYLNSSELLLINQNIIKVIQKFLDYLNRKTLNSNNKDVEINENEVFEKNFYKLYNLLQKIEQIKAIKYISENIENIQGNNNLLNKEELNYFKNLQSIFMNNGYYSCNICKK